MTTRPLQFLTSGDQPPKIRLPNPAQVFVDRAERFDVLADSHSLGEWLVFLASLTRAQHVALQDIGEIWLPDVAALELAQQHGMPPVSVASFPRPAMWRSVLQQMVDILLPQAPEGARQALEDLRTAGSEELEKLADKLLSGEPEKGDMARLPFVAAALQVVFTALASRLDASRMPLMEAPSVCPCCGSLPVVSIIRNEEPIANLRYAHCSLCNSEWIIPGMTCVTCGDEEKLGLHEIDGDDGIARAESCESCHSYLKIIYQGKNARVDPVADDLASVALDMLVDDAGFVRSGPNLLLIGAGD